MNTLKFYDAHFCLLGHRSYVHGSTITHCLLQALSEWHLGTSARIRAEFHSRLSEQGRFELLQNAGSEKRHLYTAIFKIQMSSGEKYLVGLRGRSVPINEIKPYDEDELVAGNILKADGKVISQNSVPNKLFINVAIALNKKLLQAAFPSNGFSQWFLARYDIDFNTVLAQQTANLKLLLADNIGHTRVRTAVQLSGKDIGYIYFSREVAK